MPSLRATLEQLVRTDQTEFFPRSQLESGPSLYGTAVGRALRSEGSKADPLRLET